MIIVFFPAVQAWLRKCSHLYEQVLLVMDSVGLGVFTAVGFQAAHRVQPDGGLFLQLFVGVVTGVGGGVLRDMMAGNTCYVFVKYFYACASLLGTLTCVCLWNTAGELCAMSLGAAVVLVLRLLAAHYR